MKTACYLLIAWLVILAGLGNASPQSYLIAEQPVPVFSSSTAAEAKKAIKPDACGQVRALEFIAFPGTQFEVIKQLGNGNNTVFEVTTSRYKPTKGVRLYISSHHALKTYSEKSSESAPKPPAAGDVDRRLRSAIGSPYVWGGNLRQGVQLPETDKAYAGLDCSGLLYEATEGYTPRNTSELVNFGKRVPIAGLARDQIIARLKPLDLIVWNGHLIIVLNRNETIESTLWCGRPGNGGVITMPLKLRLVEIMTRRKGVDRWPAGGGKPQVFVVRRWIGQ